MSKRIAIGTDIGGSHICCAAIDLESQEMIPGSYHDEPVNNKADAEEILGSWSRALLKTINTIDRQNLLGIGFAMPGPFDYVNGIALFERVEKYESLYGVNVVKEMQSRLGVTDRVKFRFINDATSFAIAEAWIGKAREFRRVVALTLGTGFGSAFLIGGIPVIEGDSVPVSGCVWHIPFRDGIADDYFSTRWFVGRYETLTGKRVLGVKEIADVFASDKAAQEVFNEYGSNMGEFLAPWLKKFEAEIIVIGGNVSAAYSCFGKVLQDTLLNYGVRIEIRISEMMENAAILGSSRLIEEDFWAEVKGLLGKM